ncbi:unnamed protein product, partial [Darwinula stevensoni]
GNQRSSWHTMATRINVSRTIGDVDPGAHPVLIIGQLPHLSLVPWNVISKKFGNRITSGHFEDALASLNPNPTDSCPLYLQAATVAALPSKCSRHNTPSRGHSISKIVKSSSISSEGDILIACEYRDVFASLCAVARVFPLYSRRTSQMDKNQKVVNLEFYLVGDSKKVSLSEEDVNCLNAAAEAVQLSARIVDTPCNEMNTDTFLTEIEAVGKALNIIPTIIRGDKLQEQGFGGIFGVGKAAIHPPALAVLSHIVPNATQTIAWVGKGIVYDTGGLSIKAKTSMVGMKRDCGGAAGVLGAFYLAIKQGFSQNLHAVFCLAENAVGPIATRPDDIHTLYSGRTVEINNTDAEGRLVLADGVAYAEKDLKANIILDMATLTGAQGVATGKYHGAVLTNKESWEQWTMRAGQLSGDLVFPIPYTPELHFSEFSSSVADMKNSVADRSNAQSSCAGLFIAAHLRMTTPLSWIHVDMASPVHCGERATGYGVALLNSLFGYCSQSPMLQLLSPVTAENGVDGEPILDGSLECSSICEFFNKNLQAKILVPAWDDATAHTIAKLSHRTIPEVHRCERGDLTIQDDCLTLDNAIEIAAREEVRRDKGRHVCGPPHMCLALSLLTLQMTHRSELERLCSKNFSKHEVREAFDSLLESEKLWDEYLLSLDRRLQEVSAPENSLVVGSTIPEHLTLIHADSDEQVWNHNAMVYYAEQMIAGKSLAKPFEGGEDDVHQMGGDFIVDSLGKLVYCHLSQTSLNRPSSHELLSFLRSSGSHLFLLDVRQCSWVKNFS